MEERVLEILRQVFGLEEVGRDISQKNCDAWDSMGHLNLVVELETAFDVSMEPEEIAAMKSFDDIVSLLKKKMVSR